ncbi:putative 2-aminoethylphosphonate ABC transporter ATP-binding protein [Gammaproteobacteria bacterium ESL0073]|nr:putative 2-aminoethylphosphonate ABC transporter ATP-binding protein [Gammaproteobacteria bacterium ESL0073]
MSTSYLQLINLNKKFGKFVVLNDISLTINKGELICFLGPSGCGKTTLLRIIAGLEKQSSGMIIQGDKNISFASPADRNYGIVFQSYALFPNLTIADNVAYGLVNRKYTKESIKKRVAELLQVVGLPDSGSKYPSQMSGGQQQRIALARALAASPDLLLLDEPLSALDATVRQHLRNEICNLQKQLGLTTIMVTHDQEEALSMADRVVVMNHGTIEQVGSPMEVYSSPASPFVADFIGKVNCLDAVVSDGNAFKCGDLTLQIPQQQHFNKGDKVKLYLRPEDTIIEPSSIDGHNHCTGRIKHIEFFGSNCIAELSVDHLANQSIQLQLSLNQVYDLKVKQGETLTFTVRPERIMVFPL